MNTLDSSVLWNRQCCTWLYGPKNIVFNFHLNSYWCILHGLVSSTVYVGQEASISHFPFKTIHVLFQQRQCYSNTQHCQKALSLSNQWQECEIHLIFCIPPVRQLKVRSGETMNLTFTHCSLCLKWSETCLGKVRCLQGSEEQGPCTFSGKMIVQFCFEWRQ